MCKPLHGWQIRFARKISVQPLVSFRGSHATGQGLYLRKDEMSLAEIAVSNLRCVEHVELALHPGHNLIWGGEWIRKDLAAGGNLPARQRPVVSNPQFG